MTIVLSLSISLAFGQRKLKKVYAYAEKQFYQENFFPALEAYQFVLNGDPDYEDADYKAEICSLLTEYREKSIDKLLSYESTKGKNDKFYYYWLGRAYVSKYMFEEGMETWEKFLSSKARKSEIIVEETRDFIKDARVKMDFFLNADDFEIHQLGQEINSKGAELSPVYFEEKEELLFASSRKNIEGDVFRIYHAIKQDDGWTDLSEVNVLGDFIRETANLEVVNEDGKLFLFDVKKGDLFYSETSNGKWMRPREWDSKLSSTHIKSHFFINEHEDRIVFSTNVEAKTKGLDLYQTFRDAQSGKWSKPAPFADIINGPMDEDSPYLSPDESTLYFSSNGHGSIGGLDIFKTVFDSTTRTWSEPVNLGFPINSPDDEVQFKMNLDGESGYFSSNRLNSKGDYDIYFFWEIEKIDIRGRVFNASTKSPVQDAIIKFTPSQYTDEFFRSHLDENGKYSTEIISDETYLVEIIKDKKVLFTDNFEIHETGGEKTTYIKDFVFNADIDDPSSDKQLIEDDRITEPQQVADSETRKIQDEISIEQVKRLAIDPSKKAIIHNIYFGFGTAGLSRASNPVLEELKKVLENNPEMIVEIGGHTDSIGPEEVNNWLSENRAKAVRKWLIDHGVESNRLIAKGYGESRPMASNDDEKEGRELNRRIEVMVLQDTSM